MEAWTAVGDSTIFLQNLSDPLSSALPTSVRVKGSSTAGLTNAGYWGIDVRPQKYTGSFYVKGSYEGVFTASLESVTTGETLVTVDVASKSVANEWIQHDFTLIPTTTAPDTDNTFSLTFDGSVSVNCKRPSHGKS